MARATLRLINRGDLLAALDRTAAKKVTIISTPAGSGKTSLLRAWADRSHLIPVMRVHLPAPDDSLMDPASARYTIRINGHLGATMLSAFPALVSHLHGAETVLTGFLDRSALYGVLAEIEALGLDLLEVRQLELQCKSPESGDSA